MSSYRTVYCVQLRGLGNLIAIDVSQSRLDLARELGATHTVNPATEDVTKRILNITAGLGVDNVVEATGVIRGAQAYLSKRPKDA